jgi:hypothetical protein
VTVAVRLDGTAAALMAAMCAELLARLIMRHLGEISYIEVRTVPGRRAWA